MAAVIWSEKAVAGLEDIYDYIAADSPLYARLQVERITTAVNRLRKFPESGRHLPEFSHLPYREIIVNAYRVIYRFDPETNKVFLVTALHCSRLLSKSTISAE